MRKPNGVSLPSAASSRRSGPRAAHLLRTAAFRLIKFPLLERYSVSWQWPRTADLRDWERLTIPSRSGALLAGLFGTSKVERKGVVVCAHPLTRSAKGYFLSSGRADALRRNGYDVLVFDFNGFGESSQGDFNYAQDVVAAAAVARGRAAGLPVHALAVCFGAVWTLCAAAQAQLFGGIAVEATLTSLPEYYAQDRFARAFLQLLCRLFPAAAAHATPLAAAGKLVGLPRLLVIAGLADTTTPVSMSQRLYESCCLSRPARAIWYVAHAGHLRAFETAPREYELRLTDFFAGEVVASACVS